MKDYKWIKDNVKVKAVKHGKIKAIAKEELKTDK